MKYFFFLIYHKIPQIHQKLAYYIFIKKIQKTIDFAFDWEKEANTALQNYSTLLNHYYQQAFNKAPLE